MNFMVQDLLVLYGSSFPLSASHSPGYILGWTLNLFDFVARTLAARLVIGIVLLFAISPILLFLPQQPPARRVAVAGAAGHRLRSGHLVLRKSTASTHIRK